MTDNETVNSIFTDIPITNITSGFFIGLAAGYFLKKSFKIVLFLFGLLIVALFYMQSQEIIHFNNDALLTTGDRLIALIKSVVMFIKEKLSFLQLSGGAGAVSGFVLGLKFG